MKNLLFLFIVVLSVGCKSGQTSESAKMENTQNSSGNDLSGKISTKDLLASPHREWFASGYESYKPDAATITKLKGLTNGISVKVFIGTWCKDSHVQIPKFLKILHEAGFDEEDITLVAMDRKKTTVENLESGLNIEKVPTFIFYKTTISGGRRNSSEKRVEKTKELNRIVESPQETLEADMYKILSNQSYKPRFAK